MEIEDLKVYERSMKLGEVIWTIVEGWTYYQKDTLGKQMVRAIDSVSANLSEGFGRYHYKETRHFNYFSQGSLFETKTWLTKAKNRKLISEEKFLFLMSEINAVGKMLNSYIKYFNK